MVIAKLDDIEGEIRHSTIQSIIRLVADAALTIRDQLPNKVYSEKQLDKTQASLHEGR